MRASLVACSMSEDGAGRHLLVAEHQLLGHAPAHHDGEARGHLLAAHRELVALGKLHDHAERTAARNDRRLVHRIGRLDVERDDGVAAFVIGGQHLLFFGHDQRLALGAHHHLVLGVLELVLRHHALVAPGRHQGGLVDEVHEVGAGEAGRAAGDGLEVDVRRQRHLAHVHLQDLLAAHHVRVRDDHLPVEAARAQQRRVEHVGPVGGGDQDDAFVGLEAVHLDQQLVERLLALVVAAAETGAAMAADRVDFVDEDDAGRVLLGLLEHVAHAARADADEHLDEVGAGDREERHVGLTGNGARNQRLAGAGRADEQHAARNLAAEPLEFSGVAQELDDLLQVLLGFVDARDVLEGDAAVRLGQKLCPRLAEAERLAAGALHLPGQENPHADQRDERQPRQQQRHEPRHVVLLGARGDRDALAVEALDQGRIRRGIGLEAAAVGEVAVDFRALDQDVANAALLHLVEELRERDFLRLGPLARVLEQGEQRQQQQDDDDPKGEVAQICVHST